MLKNDLEKTNLLLQKVKDLSLEYLNNIHRHDTATEKTLEVLTHLNENGLGEINSLENFKERLYPLMVATSGPRYWGFVTGGTSPAAIAGDWLCSVFDSNPQAVKGIGDLSAQIEIETITLLLDLLELPTHFKGTFVTGATMANFSCLAVARQWLGEKMNFNIAREGLQKPLTVLSACPHSSSVKSLAMLGIGSNNCILLATKNNREAIDIEALEQKIKILNKEPFILISSAGTVNSVDFDDFQAIHLLHKKYNFWWHIDAAFGAFAKCSALHKHLLNGWKTADSITIDCHKWLNVPYESAVFLVHEKYQLLQMATFQNSNAAYLGNPAENFSFLNFGPENSRRLKALPAWFHLMAYGKRGMQKIVENNIAMANLLASRLEATDLFEVLAPVHLNCVCFTFKSKEKRKFLYAFLKQVNQGKKIFMTPSLYLNQEIIRAAFVNWRTAESDIDIAIEELLQYERNF